MLKKLREKWANAGFQKRKNAKKGIEIEFLRAVKENNMLTSMSASALFTIPIATANALMGWHDHYENFDLESIAKVVTHKCFLKGKLTRVQTTRSKWNGIHSLRHHFTFNNVAYTVTYSEEVPAIPNIDFLSSFEEPQGILVSIDTCNQRISRNASTPK